MTNCPEPRGSRDFTPEMTAEPSSSPHFSSLEICRPERGNICDEGVSRDDRQFHLKRRKQGVSAPRSRRGTHPLIFQRRKTRNPFAEYTPAFISATCNSDWNTTTKTIVLGILPGRT